MMRLRLKLAMLSGFAAVGLGMPAAAHAATEKPVVLAMASYAASTAGADAEARVAAKLARYVERKKARPRDERGRGDCNDCAECADCDEVSEAQAGVCDPCSHGDRGSSSSA